MFGRGEGIDTKRDDNPLKKNAASPSPQMTENIARKKKI